MSFIARLFLLLFLTTFTSSVLPLPLIAFDEPMQSIKTGNITGVYYAAGSAVAKMHNRKLKEYNLRLIAEASEGSIATSTMSAVACLPSVLHRQMPFTLPREGKTTGRAHHKTNYGACLAFTLKT